MIKFIAAALWICAVTVGAVFYSFGSAGAKSDAKPLPLLGGLSTASTEMISVPVLRDGSISGYFLARLVYTVEPAVSARLSLPIESLLLDEVYTYVFGKTGIDFTQTGKLNLDAFRTGLRDRINSRVGEKLIDEVLIEQVDYLSKDEIRDNALRRRRGAGATARAMAKAFNEGAPAKPAGEGEPVKPAE